MRKRSMISAAAICLMLLLLPVHAGAEEIPAFDTISQAGAYICEGMSERSFTAVSDYSMTASVCIPALCAKAFVPI